MSESEHGDADATGGTLGVQRFELATRGYTTVEGWQLRDVAIDKRVTAEQLVLYLVIQSFGVKGDPKPSWPGTARLAKTLDKSPRQVFRDLAALEEHGWITRTVIGAVGAQRRHLWFPMDRVTPGDTPVMACQVPPVTPCQDSPVMGRQGELPPEELPPGKDRCPPPDPEETKKPGRRRRSKITRVVTATDIVALVSELKERYPHGSNDGKERPAPRAECERAIEDYVDGMDEQQRTAALEEIRAGCRAFAAGPWKPEDQQFNPGLLVWLNQHRWRDGGRRAGVRAPRDPRERAHGWDTTQVSAEKIRAERARIEAEKQVETPEEKAEREAEFLRRGRALASPVTSPVPDAATGSAGASQTKPADGLTDRQREARRRMGLPELGSAPPTTAAKAIERDKRRGGPPVPASVAGDVGALVGRIVPDPTAGGAT